MKPQDNTNIPVGSVGGFTTPSSYGFDQEKYNAAKELADIQGALSTARLNLQKLIANTDSYLITIDEMVEMRVVQILKQSREALDEVDANYRELNRFKQDIFGFSEVLDHFADELVENSQHFKESSADVIADLEEKSKKIANVKQNLASQKTDLELAERATNEKQVEIQNAQARLLSDRGALDSAVAEMKAKGAKI